MLMNVVKTSVKEIDILKSLSMRSKYIIC